MLTSTVSPTTTVTCNGGNNGSASVIANGGTPGYTYLWVGGAATSAVSGLWAGSYSITITDANGCTSVQSVNISQPPAFTLSAASSGESCNGSANGSAWVNNISGGISPYTYLWMPGGGTTSSISNLAGGTYTIVITDTKGCTAANTVTIPSGNNPLADFNVFPSISCNGIQVQFQDSSSQTTPWSWWIWDFGDGTTSALQNPVHTFPFGGSHNITLIVYNPPSCSDTGNTLIDLSPIAAISAANVFTPNDDLYNNCFFPVLSGTDADTLINCMHLEVFDRWGNKMFESDDSKKCWDGILQNKMPAPEGTYFYVTRFGETTIKGYVSLMR